MNQNLAQFHPLKEENIKALASKDPVIISQFDTKYTEWAKEAAV